MFNGIVEATGIIHYLENIKDCIHLYITPDVMFSDLSIGDSISVNGVCLTITNLNADSFYTTVVPETIRKTNLGQLEKGSFVNLERSLKMSDRISGHYVQGHVDSACRIMDIQHDGEDAWLVKISIPSELERYIVKKGYIAIDGMSITVIDVNENFFTVTFIPHTRKVTIANHYDVDTKVNIEVDMMAKYIEKIITRQAS